MLTDPTCGCDLCTLERRLATLEAWVTTHDHQEPPPTDDSDPLTDLPRVPWEGGPTYYNAHPPLVANGWTNPNFFPIMYWGAYVNEHTKVQAHARCGINTYGEIYAPAPQAAGWMRDANITNLAHGINGAGTEWAGHLLPDEADMWAGYGDGTWTGKWGFQGGVCTPAGEGCAPDMLRRLEAQRQADDGRVRYYNGGKGMLMWMDPPTGAKFVNGDGWPVHIVTGDLYFYSDWNLHGGDPNIPGEATTFFGVPRDQIRRAANYGEALMTRLRELDALDGRRKPLGAIVELGQVSNAGPGDFGFATLTPDRVEGAVWSALIHEARVVVYFSHGFGTQPTTDALSDGSDYYRAIQARVTKVNADVQRLAPVLNTQSYEWVFHPGLSTMLKQHNRDLYVFAMQKRVNTTGTYRLTVPPGVAGTVEVVGEARTLPLTGGAFTDSFAAEHEHHIYRIR